MHNFPQYEFDVDEGMNCLRLLVNGQCVLDGTTGKPAAYDVTDAAMRQAGPYHNPAAQMMRTAQRLAAMNFKPFVRPVRGKRWQR